MSLLVGSNNYFLYFDPSRTSGSIVLSSSNSVATATAASWSGCVSITGHSSGKFYAECMSNATIAGGYIIFGVALTSYLYSSTYPGQDANGYGAQFTNTSGARTYYNGVSTSYTSAAAQVGGSGRVAVDFSGGSLWLGDSVSGGRWYTGDPSTGTSPAYSFTPGTTLYLALGIYSNAVGILHNHAGENLLSVPAGFSMWG